MIAQPRLVEVRKNVLKQNDLVASELRRRFERAGVIVVSLVSSPGAGKTMLLERTLSELHQEHRVAALVGDLATDNDAARLSRSGAPVKQITTGTVCHLEAGMVRATVPAFWRAMAKSVQAESRLRIPQIRQIPQCCTCAICGAQRLAKSCRLRHCAA